MEQRFFKRILALLLCFVMAFSTVSTALAEDHDTFNYVSIGASNVNGYGLRGYLTAEGYDKDTVMEAAALNKALKAAANVLGYKQAPEDSYPARLKGLLGTQLNKTVKLSQLAISSMRVEELRFLLDDSYSGDAYTNWRFADVEGYERNSQNWFVLAGKQILGDQEASPDAAVAKIREEYRNSIKDADLITVDIGVNNFGVYLSYMLTSNYSLDNDLKLVDPEINKLYSAAKEKVLALLQENNINAGEYVGLVDTLAYALVGFCYNFDKSMEKIYELNPNAQVVVVSIQNLLTGLKVKVGDIVLPLGDLMGALINVANAYIAVGSPYSSKYLCADVRQNGRVEFFIDEMAKYIGDPESLDPNIIDCFDVWDGSPGEEYERGFHIKYQLAKLAIKKGVPEESVADYLKNDGKELLNKAYDAYAQILSTCAKEETLDFAVLTSDKTVKNKIEEELTKGILGAIEKAVEQNEKFVLPETFFSEVAQTCGTSESIVKTVAAMAVRTDIGNSFFAHPTPDGHAAVEETILAALENKTTGKDIMINEAKIAGKQLYTYLKEHGNELPGKISEIYEYAVDIDLIPPEVQETIANAITTIKQAATTVEKVVEVERKVVRGVATVAVVGGVTYLGVSAVRHMVDKYQAANSQSEIAVSINTVSDAQQWLNENYDAGLTVDGGYGNMTKQAIVKALQKELGFTGADVDGVAGQKTLNALPELNGDSQGNTVVLLQCLLLGSGYGNDVEQAVLTLQKAQGMAQTGVCDSQLWKALLS